MPMQQRHLYQFGPFLLDSSNRVLSRAGTALPLPPKAFETLLVLVERHGNLVGKEELLKAVWPDTFVEENNITQYISLLRRVLGEAPDQRQYIETVPRLGYRFVAPVRSVELTETAEPAQQEEGPTTAEDGLRLQPTTVTPSFHGKQSVFQPWWIALLIGVAAAAWISVRFWQRTAKPQPSPSAKVSRRVVAVLGFKNLAASADSEWLSTALAEMLNTELSAGERLRALSGEDVSRVKNDLKIAGTNILSRKTLAEVHNSLGADVTVSGSYLQLGSGMDGQLRLDIQLQDTGSGDTIGSIAETGTVSDLFELINRSGKQLRAKLGVAEASTVEEGQVRAALPSTPEAARLYSQGLELLRAFDAPTAERLFAKALTIDPNFALGHSAMARSWSALGYDQKAKAEAQRAFELSNGMPREERLQITGDYHEMSREWDKAVETYQQLFTLFPDNLEYGLRLMNAQTSAGHGKEARATAASLRALPAPSNRDPQIDLAEANAVESLGQFREELQSADAAATKGESLGEHLLVARALVRKAWASSRLGQGKQAVSFLTYAQDLFRGAGDRQGIASTSRLMAAVLLSEGEYANADAAANEALRDFREIGDKRGMASSLNNMASICYERGELERAKSLYGEILKIQREVGSKVNVAGALGNIANVLEAEGRLAEAQELTEESISVFSEVGDQRALGTALANLADLLYEEGDLRRARKSYDDAIKIHRTTGYQRGLAYDLAGLSQVSEAENDLVAARKHQEEALAIRNDIGEKQNAAVSTLGLAELALDQGKAAEAETILVRVTELLGDENSPANQTAAQILLASSLLAEGKVPDAEKAISRATDLAHGNLSFPLRFELLIATSYVRTAGHLQGGPATQVETALRTSLQQAHKLRYAGYEFRLRLALGEIEVKNGNAAQGRSRLEQLVRDSTSKGFHLVAGTAKKALVGAST